MSDTLLGVIQGCPIHQRPDKSVYFTADADIDADGANGQSGVWAYKEHDKGVEYLANAGYPTTSWYPDILVCDENDEPIIYKDGGIASRTAYEWDDVSKNDPNRWVDSNSVPYVVVPPAIRKKAKGVVLGCLARIVNIKNKKWCWAVVADIGPQKKVGEISIEAANLIGINSDPKHGGTDDNIISYELFPDKSATINGVPYNLIPA